MSETGTFTGEIWRQPYSAQQLQDAAANQIPIIRNGYWYTWDIATGLFVNSGVPADVATGKLNVIGKGINLLENAYFIGGGSQQGGGQFPINQRAGYVVPPGRRIYKSGAGRIGTTDTYYTVTGYIGNDNNPTFVYNGETCYSDPNVQVPGYTGSGYGIDRWLFVQAGSSLTINADSITVSAGAGIFSQVVPNVSSLFGQQVTGSLLTADGELFSGSGVLASGGSVLFYQSGAGSNLLQFYLTSTGYFQFYDLAEDHDFVAAKLELGSEQTLAHQDENGTWVLNDPPPNYQQELAKCRRYYRECGIGMLGLMQPNLFVFTLPFDEPMRAAPTLTLKTQTVDIFYGRSGINITNATIGVQATSPFGIVACGIQGSFSATLAEGSVARLNMDSNILAVSSEL